MIRLELDVPPTTVDIKITSAGRVSYYVRPLNDAVVVDIKKLIDTYIKLATNEPGNVTEPRGITVYRALKRVTAPFELREISVEISGSPLVH
ncbi:MAG: hypothetical protein VKO21_12210 [Candidatus Sericytochromatia bacterium]|nr:hypothetical protein [Candidatus Sericytochromatia bacterium]